MMRLVALLLFKLTGWKTQGEVPPLKKFVAIAAPHTSGWDFIVGMLGKYIYRIQFRFLAKQELFKPPFGWLLRWLGGIPVNRSSPHNMVEQAVELFNRNDEMILALAPEGTRSYVPQWRKGFYYIATGANVPIVLCFIDFGTKTVGVGPTFYPTGNYEEDIKQIALFYRSKKGYHAELATYR